MAQCCSFNSSFNTSTNAATLSNRCKPASLSCLQHSFPLLLSLLFTLLLLISPLSLADQRQSIRIVTLMDFKPFIWCEQGVPKGIDIDIAKVLLHQAKQPYSLECLPWKRALNMIKNGQADMLLSAYKTEQRKSFAHFSAHPIHMSSFSIFVARGQGFKYRDLDSLASKRIAIPMGYSISPEFDAAKLRGEFNIVESSSTENGIQMLLKGRVDAYINGGDVVRYSAREMGLSHQIEALNQPLSKPRPAYFMFSKAADVEHKLTLLDSLNQTLAQMWSDGSVEKIVDTYTRFSPQRNSEATALPPLLTANHTTKD